MYGKGIVVVCMMTLLSGCAYIGFNNKIHAEQACLPGTQCYDQLPVNAQADKRKQWMLQRERMQFNQQYMRLNSLYVARPVTSY